MKAYDIFDNDLKKSVGTLLYYEKSRAFIVELEDWLDEWTAPLMFTGFVKRGIYTVAREESELWVRSRIIPPGRQNIQSILATHKLKEYSEISFLEMSGGRCSQDAIEITPLGSLPEYVTDREKHNLKEAVLCEKALLCFFNDGCMKKINIEKLAESDDSYRHLDNEIIQRSCAVGVGGYSLSFGGALDIPAGVLYEWSQSENITLSDFRAFVVNNILDTTETCRLASCSRQNLAYLVGQEQLHTIRANVKGNLYIKGDVLSMLW